MQQRKYWLLGCGLFCVCLVLFLGVKVFILRLPSRGTHLPSTTFVSFQTETTGIKRAQLDVLEHMALTSGFSPTKQQVRDMETNQFVAISSIIFSEIHTLTKPYYEPMIDQQKKVMYAFMQRCQQSICWIDLYRDPTATATQRDRSFVIMYMNAWYALTHERNAQQPDHFHALTAYQTAL